MRQQNATCVIPAAPDSVFALITSVERLPEWNGSIVRVVESPAQLTPGAEWVVELSALGQSWPSRSTVVEVDGADRRFVYRSQTDDGNPSYAEWTWRVADAPGGSMVTVSYALHPATFWRRVLLAKIRGRQLRRRELPESLRALASLAPPASS
ncbi:MAG: SRPBCC family protein [Actinomycetota bacterium]